MDLHNWMLPLADPCRTGLSHRGRIQRDVSNQRWCSDGLEIACWNGDVVQVAFALECHDREVMGHVAVPCDLRATNIQQLMEEAVVARVGVDRRPDSSIQWLSDNGIIYTALQTISTAERLHVSPITTPPSSPQSNGTAEVFVHTIRRDHQAGADLSTAEHVMAQIPAWITDHIAVAPHSALGQQPPKQ